MAWKRQDYLNKYQPLLYLLNSEDDLDCLAAEPGYSRVLGREHRRSRLNLLRGYLLELEADFDALYREAVITALEDRELAERLACTEEVLKKTVRHVRRQLWIEQFIPVPFASPKPHLVRRLIVRFVRKNGTTRDLLAAMDSIQRKTSFT